MLRVLGGSAGDSEGALLLGHLAEGLERHGYQGLAAQAYTLAWTRARGGGGWLNFGGETALDALHNATRLDPAIAADLVAEETERIVASGRYGTNGVTQALIIAFAAKALAIARHRPGRQCIRHVGRSPRRHRGPRAPSGRHRRPRPAIHRATAG